MTIIPLHYDAYNRQFKLSNPEQAKLLEDGCVYLLMDFPARDLEPETATPTPKGVA
jgi:hypothetical protein